MDRGDGCGSAAEVRTRWEIAGAASVAVARVQAHGRVDGADRAYESGGLHSCEPTCAAYDSFGVSMIS